MNRFIHTHYDNKLPDNYYDYMDYPVLPLGMALEPLLWKIDQLHTRITFSERYCCRSLDNKLTNDESATIHLYTHHHAEQSIYYQLNEALRSENLSMLKPWLGFLRLFYSALEKLPTMKGTIWRGIHIDIAKNFQENQNIFWCGVTSCSLSVDRIKTFLDQSSVLCAIESITGKSIRGYTHYLKEEEVLLLPGTRLRVKRNAYDSSLCQRVIHLIELNDENHETLAMIRNPTSSTNRLPQSTSDPPSSMETFISKATVTVKNHASDIDSSVIRFSNGDQYEATFKNGDKQGDAKFFAISGVMYEGYSTDVRANGDGVRTCSYGDRYEGTFHYGKMSGYGTYSRADGYTYVGNWIDDEPYGKGISTWPNGNHYEGDHQKGKIQGCGIFCSLEGDKYEGELIDGKAHGRGVRYWINGDRYEGNFKDDKKHGYGSYHYAAGGKYVGNWAYDEMDGDSLLVWASGSCYKGTFKNGKKHGWGKLTFANGHVQDGRWKK